MIEKIDMLTNKLNIKLLRGMQIFVFIVALFGLFFGGIDNPLSVIIFSLFAYNSGKVLVAIFKESNPPLVWSILGGFYAAVWFLATIYFEIRELSPLFLITLGTPAICYIIYLCYKVKNNKF